MNRFLVIVSVVALGTLALIALGFNPETVAKYQAERAAAVAQAEQARAQVAFAQALEWQATVGLMGQCLIAGVCVVMVFMAGVFLLIIDGQRAAVYGRPAGQQPMTQLWEVPYEVQQ